MRTDTKARIKVLEMIYKAQSSHIGSNFSVIEILSVLFKNKREKDEIILSAGWKAASFYYFLAETGVIPKKDLNTYCKEGSKYIGLTEPKVRGVRFAGGSMGMGFPASVGFALSKKLKGEEGVVYCVMSDGELASGTTWEAANIAVHHKLDNLCVLIDANEFQAMGKVKDILNVGFPASGWNTEIVDGHNMEELKAKIFDIFEPTKNMPRVFMCQTVKGKGVSFMEWNNDWHYKNLTKEDYTKALKEL